MGKKPGPGENRVLVFGDTLPTDNVFTTSQYTAINFIFKNLRQQFRRVANLYFLTISVLQLGWSELSPTSKYATVGPLIVIITISAIKEAVEDCARHREDNKVNSQDATVLTGDHASTKAWRDVRCGDVVKVSDGERFPADMLLLRTSNAAGKCYIETAELDGETNLKIKQAQADMLQIGAAPDISSFDTRPYTDAGAELVYEQPNNRLYEFKGTCSWGDLTVAVQNDAVLLRGAMLRNTEAVVGIVIYTGKDTKLSMNMTKAKPKLSDVERVVNRCIFLIFFALIVICCASTAVGVVWIDEHETAPYLPFLFNQKVGKSLLNFVTYLILYNNLVPISLYVTLEIVKLKMAMFVAHDPKMYYAPKKMWALARTSNIPEDLGQIQYIFSDKTGTLTRNEMEFKKLSIGTTPGLSDGTAFTYLPHVPPPPGFTALMPENDLTKPDLWQMDSSSPHAFSAAHKYFTALAVCHTVVPETKDGDIKYQAESPDEEAIVIGAKQMGFELVEAFPKGGKDWYRVLIDCPGDPKTWEFEKCEVNAFNSTRKRMSIVIRTPAGLLGQKKEKIMLYAKGADMMMERDCGVELPEFARRHLKSFAMEGLRTLVVAEKEITEEQYAMWRKMRQEAEQDLENQARRLDEAAAFIERGMTFVGVTAIEDKLQEGVPDAIANLRKADLKIWVLTGDKEETAINIGKSCNLLDGSMDHYIIRGDNTEMEPPVPYSLAEIIEIVNGMTDALTRAQDNVRKLALVVDGKALGELFREYDPKRDDGTASEFAQLQGDAKKLLVSCGNQCAAVIGCRVSPKQKRDIVKLVKDNMTPVPIALAIGDGANDVPMIQEAHIGVGISGNEGVQAARSADYAIGQFKYLERLLLVHGRWNYRRICSVILYSFYKTITMVFTLFLFGFVNGASGTTLYETWLSSCYSVLWTAFPVLAMGFYNQDVPEDIVLAHPSLYKVGQDKLDLNLFKIAGMLLNCVWHSLVISAVPYFLFRATGAGDGRTDGLYVFGTTVNVCCMLVVNIKSGLMTSYWTMTNLLSYVFSVGVWFVFVAVYSELYFVSPRFFGLGEQLYQSPDFWLSIPLVLLIACLPDYVLQHVQFNYFPKPWDRLRKDPTAYIQADETHEDTPLLDVKTGGATHPKPGSMASVSGFDFSVATSEGVPQYATHPCNFAESGVPRLMSVGRAVVAANRAAAPGPRALDGVGGDELRSVTPPLSEHPTLSDPKVALRTRLGSRSDTPPRRGEVIQSSSGPIFRV
jgi:phospholipid-transporting ATPase